MKSANPPDDEQLLTINELCRRWKIDRSTLWRQEQDGRAPPRIDIRPPGADKPRWRFRLGDVRAFEGRRR